MSLTERRSTKTIVFMLVAVLVFTCGMFVPTNVDAAAPNNNGENHQLINSDDTPALIFYGSELNNSNNLGYTNSFYFLSGNDISSLKDDTDIESLESKFGEGFYITSSAVTYSGIKTKNGLERMRRTATKYIDVKTVLNTLADGNPDLSNVYLASYVAKNNTLFNSTVDLTKNRYYFDYLDSAENYITGNAVEPIIMFEGTYNDVGVTPSSMDSETPLFIFGQTGGNDFSAQGSWMKNVDRVCVGENSSVLTANIGGGGTEKWTIADILNSPNGFYSSEYEYDSTTSKAYGAPLLNLLEDRSVENSAIQSVTAVAKGGATRTLTTSELSRYFVAPMDENMKFESTTPLVLLGPGATEDEVIFSDLESLNIHYTKPTSPTIKITSTTHDKINLSWNKIANAEGYILERYDSKTKKWAEIKDIENINTVSYSDTGLKTGLTYTYRIQSYKTIGNNEVYGNYNTTAAKKLMLAKAKKPTAKKSGKKAAVIKWKKVDGASGYEIFRATKKKGKYKKITTIKNNKKQSYKNKKLKKGKKYYYKVRAYKTVDGKKVYGAFSAIRAFKR